MPPMTIIVFNIQWISAISNSHGTSKNVRDSGKFKILAFCKALGKPITVFNSVLTLVSQYRIDL